MQTLVELADAINSVIDSDTNDATLRAAAILILNKRGSPPLEKALDAFVEFLANQPIAETYSITHRLFLNAVYAAHRALPKGARTRFLSHVSVELIEGLEKIEREPSQ